MNYNKVFELVLQSKQFDKYEQKLSEDDYAAIKTIPAWKTFGGGDIANSENKGLPAGQRYEEMGETCRNGKLWDSCTCC